MNKNIYKKIEDLEKWKKNIHVQGRYITTNVINMIIHPLNTSVWDLQNLY